MDARDMTFETSRFDVIIDKSTIDTLLCGNFAYLNVAIMLRECQRVLKTGGLYIAISYSSPEFREEHLKRENLNFDVQTFQVNKTSPDTGKTSTQHVYICKKLEDVNSDENWPKVVDHILLEMEDESINEFVEEQFDNDMDPIIKNTLI